MAGKCPFIAVLLLSGVSLGSAEELAIVSGGTRIVDRDPGGSASNCSGWAYGPAPLVGATGEIEAMYTVSDAIANHCAAAIDSPLRFGDTIRYHARNSDGSWDGGFDIIGRTSFWWMNDRNFVREKPQSFVGHVASPTVVRDGDRYFMAFVGSVDDRNLCAGEHYEGNSCGSCFEPWSYFVVMWATSDDGIRWRIRERAPGDARLIGRPVTASDRNPGINYKGITHVSMVLAERDGARWFYIGGHAWMGGAIKPVLFRIRYDPKSEWGLSGDPQLWSLNRRAWIECPAGVLPDFFSSSAELSFPPNVGPISSISRVGDGYIALWSSDSWHWVRSSRSSQILMARSSDLVNWGSTQTLRSAVGFFADGTAYDASVIDPIVVETKHGLRLLMASADGDPNLGIVRDGYHDCAPAGEFGPTAPYVGTGIYEAAVEIAEMQQTSTVLEPVQTRVARGSEARFVIRVTSANGPPPEGYVVLNNLTRGNFTIARLLAGRAEVTMSMPAGGVERFHAWYNEHGIWRSSSSATVTVEAGDLRVPARRRAARR